MNVTVPVVSLAGLADGDCAALARVAREIDDACTGIGFFAVVDHGVDTALRAGALARCVEFFALDAGCKEQYRMSCPPGVHRGYAGLGAEAQAAAVGIATRPDRSETFTVGPLRDIRLADDFAVADVWPDADIPGFQTALAAYREAVDELGRRILGACSLALFDDTTAMPRHLTEPLGGLRANHYPTLDRHLAPDEWRAGAHTDYSTLTILATDDVAGLEILVDERWQPVGIPADSFLVNVGDLLAVASGDRWRSTWHRVGTPPGVPPFPARTTLAFFQYPDADARIAGLRDAHGVECTAGDYLRAKVRLLFGT